MFAPKEVLDTLVHVAIHPLLKSHAFQRRKLTWNRRLGEITQVIDLQTGRWGTHRHLDFTFNVGLFVPSVYEAVWDKRSPSFVSISACAYVVRAADLAAGGNLVSSTTDEWWDITSDTDLATLRASVTEALTLRVLPFLEHHTSERSVLALLLAKAGMRGDGGQESVYAAVILQNMGESVRAAQLLKAVVVGDRFDGWGPKAAIVARRLGIDLDCA